MLAIVELQMTQRNLHVLILLCVALTIGCASSSITLTGEPWPYYEGIVSVLEQEPDVTVKFVEIGWVSSTGYSGSNWTDCIAAMQNKAAYYGANAIILTSQQTSRVGSVTYVPNTGLYGNSYNQKNMMARAIRILKSDEIED